MLEQGELPLRVTHNDTKINNLLVDEVTGKGLCIVDLDTTMPGLAAYDFGDMVRTAAALVVEDEPDWRKAGISLESFDSLAHGYLDAARIFLIPAEIENLSRHCASSPITSTGTCITRSTIPGTTWTALARRSRW
jgi:Ser/Thr protein kinase RdoA (MazF antagonist)